MPNQDISISPKNLALIVDAVRGILQNNLATPGPPGPLGPIRPPGVNLPVSFNYHDTKFHAAELGFFDPYFNGKSIATVADIKHTSRDTYFRDIHMFVQQAKDLISAKREQLIRDNLFTYLRGTALQWYTSKLSIDQKTLVKYGNGIVKWEKQLFRRFRIALNQAIMVITNEKYTVDNARKWRES